MNQSKEKKNQAESTHSAARLRLLLAAHGGASLSCSVSTWALLLWLGRGRKHAAHKVSAETMLQLTHCWGNRWWEHSIALESLHRGSQARVYEGG